MPSPSAPLQRGPNPSFPRYYLDGRPLTGGATIQLCLSGGWLTGRYEYDAGIQAHPFFFFTIELEGGQQASRSIELPDGALVRWP